MQNLTPLENECLLALEAARDILAFAELMTKADINTKRRQIDAMILRLQNKQLGGTDANANLLPDHT